MRKSAPYMIFGVVYLALVLGAGVVVDGIDNQLANHILDLLVPVAVAPMAIIVAKRVGHLAPLGTVLAATVGILAMYAVVTGIYSSLAAPTDGSFSLLALARMGGWPLAFSYLAYIVVPVLWLPLVKARTPRDDQTRTMT